MNDRVNAAVDARDIGGAGRLGRGVNLLKDWTSASPLPDKVGDTETDKRTEKVLGTDYLMGANVSCEADTGDVIFDETFFSSEEFQKHMEASVEGDGSYGAFSGGFQTTFGSDISVLHERSATVHNVSKKLWHLSMGSRYEVTTRHFKEAAGALPRDFNSANAKQFLDFFQKYGTDIVTGVTVGAALNYTTLFLKSYETSKTAIEAMAHAEFSAFVSGKADAKMEEEVKKHLVHRISNLAVRGGDPDVIHYDGNNPKNCNEGFQAWQESVKGEPVVVGVKLTPIFQFVDVDGLKEVKKALEGAYTWFSNSKVSVTAAWSDSTITVGKNLEKAGNRTSGVPAVRIVVVDSKTQTTTDERIVAPGVEAGPGPFEEFWRRVSGKLDDIDQADKRVLLTTERWPRDARYCPRGLAREALMKHGANEATLRRWDVLTSDVQPCRIAGLSYALAGNSSANPGVDGIAVGFSKRGKDPSPTVSLATLLSYDRWGHLVQSATREPKEETGTELHTIRIHVADNHITVDPVNKSQLRVKENPGDDPSRLWFIHSKERNTQPGYEKFTNPCILVNYATCGAIQAKEIGNAACVLAPMSPEEEFMVWDVRDEGGRTNFVLVCFKDETWNLMKKDEGLWVRKWEQPYMRWTLDKKQPA